MDSDLVPAKRLRYSPESKHAPQPKVSYEEQQQQNCSTCFSQSGTVAHSPSKSGGSAASCIGSDTASERQPAPNAGLRATAAPWTPAKFLTQNNTLAPDKAWQSLYGPSIFGSLKSSDTGNQAKGVLSAVFDTHSGQVCPQQRNASIDRLRCCLCDARSRLPLLFRLTEGSYHACSRLSAAVHKH